MRWARIIILSSMFLGAAPLLGADSSNNTFSGKVLNSHGRALAGAFVSVVTQTGELRGAGKTGDDGAFSIAVPGAPPGEARWAVADVPGLGMSEFRRVKGVGRILLELQLQADAPVRMMADGAPAVGMTVRPVMIDIAYAFPRQEDHFRLPEEMSRRWALKTDAAGMVVFCGIHEPSEIIHFDHDHPRYSAPGNQDTFRSGAPGASPVLTIALTRAATISGTVTYAATGKPAAGVAVLVSGGSDRKHVVSDQAGQFSLDRLAAGRCYVGIELSNKSDFLAPFQQFDLAAGETHQVSISLVSGGLVVGTVKDAETGKGIAGAFVGGGTRAQTDGDGNYSMRALPGKVTVMPVWPLPDGYQYPTNPNGIERTEVTVVEGTSTTVNFDLPRDPSPLYRGTVVDADGLPVSDAKVTCNSPPERQPAVQARPATAQQPGTRLAGGATALLVGSLSIAKTVQTDAAGAFSIHGAVGSQLSAQFDDLSSGRPLVLNSPSAPINLRLSSGAHANLAVKVTDDAGAAVEGAEVKLVGTMATKGFTLQTEKDGMATFDCASDGVNSIWVQAPGFAGASERVPAGQHDAKVKLQRANSSIEGFVVDDQGNPVGHVEVFLLTQSTGSEGTETDANGHFSFDAMDGLNATVHLRGIAPEGMARAKSGQTNIKFVLSERKP